MITSAEVAHASDVALTQRWLTRTRRGVVALQIVLMVLAEAGTNLHVHSPALLAVIAAMLLADVIETAWTRRQATEAWLVVAHGVVDLIGLTGILALSGGPRNPLMSAYLVYIALLAMVLPAPRAWAVAGLAMVMQAFVVLHPGHLPGLEAEALPPLHLLGHIVAFDLAAVAIVWVVSQLSASLRARDADELSRQRRRAATDRLAALGTLTAGVAHELGTPLGTIQLVTEEQASGMARSTVLEQVDRCRSILDRLRGSQADGADCVPDPAGWVAEWTRAAPDVAVDVTIAGALGRVAGAEANWRGAVWVALDNARRAGAGRVALTVLVVDGAVELQLRDDGCGLDAGALAHSGEPFHTGWGGTGLGLFVARSFAQSVGGDVALTANADRGALVTIRMPLATP